MNGWPLALVVCLTTAYVLGCSSETTPVATPTASVTVALPTSALDPAAAQPSGTRTGVAEVDEAMQAVEARDEPGLAALLHYFPWPCTTKVGIGAFPCIEGEVEGTEAEAIAMSGCEGSFHRKGTETAELIANFIRFNDGKLYAVLRATPYRLGEQVPGDYLILYANGQSIGVDAGGITYLHFACGGDAAMSIKVQEEAGFRMDYLLPPP
jgi:hypothetical protein